MPDADKSGGETVSSLLDEVVSGVTQLMKGEFALVRPETQQSVRDAGNAVFKLAAAAVLVIVVLNLIAAAAVAALIAAGLSLEWACLAVGAAFLLIAFTIVALALPLLSPSHLALKRSFASLRRDAEILKSMVTPHAA